MDILHPWEKRRSGEERKRPNDTRTPWDRDYSRIIHSAAFRRLQSKTQVLGLGESDFYRTRLTHSLEVAQIAEGITSHLQKNYEAMKTYLPDNKLISSIGLAHDLGHPPFGHGGETALNYCMADFGGFEGNGQTLRILSKLEKYSVDYGLDPTRRLLLGVLKYPVSYSSAISTEKVSANVNSKDWLFQSKLHKPPKCYLDSEKDVVDWILEPFSENDKELFRKLKPAESDNSFKKSIFKSLDASIMEFADDISYSVHDFEDAITLKLITKESFEKYYVEKFGNLEQVYKIIENCINDPAPNFIEDLFSDNPINRKERIGELVNVLISNTEISDKNISEEIHFESPLLQYNVTIDEEYDKFRHLFFDIVVDKVIKNENVQLLELKGQRIVWELFSVFKSDPLRFLPSSAKESYQKGDDEKEKNRTLCDYIAGMTDEYATRLHEKIFNTRKGSVFDIL